MAPPTLGEAFITVRADTSAFNASLATGLKSALATAQSQANSNFKSIAASARVAAKGTSEAFVAASRDISSSVVAASKAVDQALAQNAQRLSIIQATGGEAAAALARDFGLAASAGTAAFEAAGRQVAAAIAFAVEQGEKSLLRLATRAALAADAVENSLRLAAQGIQGPLRIATDAIAKDLFDLAKVGDVTFADITTAGNITAAKLAESLGIAAGTMAAEIDAAALEIATALGRAVAAGETSFVRLSTVAAEAASAASDALVTAMNEVRAAEVRAGQGAAVLEAKLTAAANAAASSLSGTLATAVGVVAADLSELGSLGQLQLSDVGRAADIVAAELESQFGAALNLTSIHFQLMTSGALRDFATLVAGGTATAAELELAFVGAVAKINANLRETAAIGAGSLGGVAGAAKAVAAETGVALAGVAGPFREALVGIAADFSTLALSWHTTTADIEAVTARTTASLRTEFGLTATAISAEFDAAALAVSDAIKAAVARGETSLIRLAQVGRSTAGLLGTEFAAAGATAAAGIQGPLRVAIEAIAADFQQLRAAPLKFESDVTAAGRLAADALASSLGIAAGTMVAEIEAAAKAIGLALKTASDSGGSLARIGADAAVAAETARATLVAALNEITAAEIRAGFYAGILDAKLTAAAKAAGDSLKGNLGIAVKAAAADLGRLAEIGQLSLLDIDAAAGVVAGELEAKFGSSLGLVTAEFRAMTTGALTSVSAIAAAGDASAAEIEAAFLAAVASIDANLSELPIVGGRVFGQVAEEAKASAAKIGAAFKDAANVSNAALGSIAGFGKTAFLGFAAGAGIAAAAIGVFGIAAVTKLESIKVAFDGIIEGQDQFKGNLEAGQKASTEFFNNLKDFAKLTPFQFPELADASQRLLAIGLTGQQTIATLNDIGNAVSAVGGNGENLKKVVLAIGQINSYTKVTADNLNQISNALPNFNRAAFAKTIAELRAVKERGDGAKATTKELAQATQDLHDGAVASGIGIEALIKTLREAPGAEGAMIRQSKTLAGILSNVKDSARFSLTDAFSDPKVLDPIKNALITFEGTFQKFIATVAPAVGQIVVGLDPLVNDLLPALGDALVPIFEIFGKLLAIVSPVLDAIVTGFGQVFTAVGPGLETLATELSAAFLDVLPQLTQSIVDLVPELVALAEALLPILPAIVQLIASGLQILGPILDALTPTIEAMVNAFLQVLKIPGVEKIFGAILLAIGGLLLVIGPLTALIEFLAGAFLALEIAAEAAAFVLAAVGAPALIVAGVIAAVTIAVIALYKHFETARTIINKALTVILTAVKFWAAGVYTAITGLAEAILRAFSLMAKAIGKIPIIGRPFDRAAAGIDAAISGIDSVRDAILSIPTEVTSHINIVVNETTLRDASIQGPTQALANEFTQEKTLRRAADKAKAEAAARDKALADRLKRVVGNTVGGTGFAPGGAAVSSAADKAAKKAADVAAKFSDAIAAILLKLDSDFKFGLIHDSAEQIKKTLQGIGKDIAKAFDAAGKPRPSKLLALIKSDTDKLRALATERDAVLKKLEAATAKAKDIADAVRSFANITSVDFTKSVDAAANAVAKLSITTLDVAGSFQVVSRTLDSTAAAASDQLKHTGEDFAAALKGRLDAIRAFQADIDTLIQKGVRRSLIDQILGAGVEGGAASADALANASAATIAGINKTQDAINAAAKKLGNTAAENFFRSGGEIVAGLIDGLKKRKGEIFDEMTAIATALIKAIRKTLKSASPSKVMRDIGQFAGLGLKLGLHDSLGGVLAAGTALAKAAVPTLAPISLGNLQAASDAQAVAVMRQQLGAQGPAGSTTQITNNRTKEINAPITQHFHGGGGMTPVSALAAMNAAVARGMRG